MADPFAPFFDEVRRIVREEIAAGSNGPRELMGPEELAKRLKVPLSWVYEQSRQNLIPTHRIGRYIRFDLNEVLDSLKIKELKSPLTRVK
jgi:excisionase family DNA binding protein